MVVRSRPLDAEKSSQRRDRLLTARISILDGTHRPRSPSGRMLRAGRWRDRARPTPVRITRTSSRTTLSEALQRLEVGSRCTRPANRFGGYNRAADNASCVPARQGPGAVGDDDGDPPGPVAAEPAAVEVRPRSPSASVVRSAWDPNLVALSDDQLTRLKIILDECGMAVLAIASPIGMVDVAEPIEYELKAARRRDQRRPRARHRFGQPNVGVQAGPVAQVLGRGRLQDGQHVGQQEQGAEDGLDQRQRDDDDGRSPRHPPAVPQQRQHGSSLAPRR